MRLTDTAGAAAMLGVSTSTLEKSRVRGDGPRFKKFGAKVLYDVADLEAFIAEMPTQRSTAEGAARKGGPGRPRRHEPGTAS